MKVPVLKLPDFDKDFEIRSDASDFTIGDVIMQDGRPVFAPLVSPKWECQTPTPENGSLESSGTPKNSEDNLKD